MMGMTSSVTATMSSPNVVMITLRCRMAPPRHSNFKQFGLESCFLTEDPRIFSRSKSNACARTNQCPDNFRIRAEQKSLSVAAWVQTDSDEEKPSAFRQPPKYRLQFDHNGRPFY